LRRLRLLHLLVRRLVDQGIDADVRLLPNGSSVPPPKVNDLLAARKITTLG